MAQEQDSTKRLLALRRLTRALSDLLREQVADYVQTLVPLLRPAAALRDAADTRDRDPLQTADKTFRELQSLYETVAVSEPFNLRKELRLPIETVSWGIEIAPLEYVHQAKTDAGSKPVMITSPLKWVLSFTGMAADRLSPAGFPVRRLRVLLADRNRSADDLRQFVLHHLLLHMSLAKQPGVFRILENLRFPTGTERLPEFGALPLTVVSSVLSTTRPSDEVLIEHTEISGQDAFEEVVSPDDIAGLRDPLREKVLELAKKHGVALDA